MSDSIDSPVSTPLDRGVELDEGFAPFVDLRNESLATAVADVLPPALSGDRDDSLAGAIWLGSAIARARADRCHDDRSIAGFLASDLARTLADEPGDRRISITSATEVVLAMSGVVDLPSRRARELVAQLVGRVELRSGMLPDGVEFGDAVNDMWHAFVNVNLPRRTADQLLVIATDDETPWWAGRDVADKVVAARVVLGIRDPNVLQHSQDVAEGFLGPWSC